MVNPSASLVQRIFRAANHLKSCMKSILCIMPDTKVIQRASLPPIALMTVKRMIITLNLTALVKSTSTESAGTGNEAIQ